jgi:hypothetical protein
MLVGYGDIAPSSNGGKLFATIYILVGGTILINNMSLISMIPLELRKRRIERAVLTQVRTFAAHLLCEEALPANTPFSCNSLAISLMTLRSVSLQLVRWFRDYG